MAKEPKAPEGAVSNDPVSADDTHAAKELKFAQKADPQTEPHTPSKDQETAAETEASNAAAAAKRAGKEAAVAKLRSRSDAAEAAAKTAEGMALSATAKAKEMREQADTLSAQLAEATGVAEPKEAEDVPLMEANASYKAQQNRLRQAQIDAQEQAMKLLGRGRGGSNPRIGTAAPDPVTPAAEG